MSFDFSDLVIENDNECYNYDNFLSDAIYDWLKEPENVLNACDAIEEKQQQQAKPKEKNIQLFNKHNHKVQLIIKDLHILEDHTRKKQKRIKAAYNYYLV